MAAPEVGRLYQGVAKESTAFRLMKQMGWEEGDGLGKNKQGISTHVRVSKKFDQSGIGVAEARKEASNWTVNTAIFDAILKNLNIKAKGGSSENVSHKSESQNPKPESEDAPPAAKKLARPQGRYKRREAGKCVKTYSESDLSAILGVAPVASFPKISAGTLPAVREADEEQDGRRKEKRSKKRKQNESASSSDNDSSEDGANEPATGADKKGSCADQASSKKKKAKKSADSTEENINEEGSKKKRQLKASKSDSALTQPSSKKLKKRKSLPSLEEAEEKEDLGAKSDLVSSEDDSGHYSVSVSTKGKAKKGGEGKRKEKATEKGGEEKEEEEKEVELAPLPADWWGHRVGFVRGGSLGAARKSKAKKGEKGFSEADQEGLYHLVNEKATIGKQGLGIGSLPKKVGGVRWKGQKKTFDGLAGESSGEQSESDKEEGEGEKGRQEGGEGEESGKAEKVKWKKIIKGILKEERENLTKEELFSLALERGMVSLRETCGSKAKLGKKLKSKMNKPEGTCFVMERGVVQSVSS